MTALRETTKKLVIDALDRTYFTADSFSVNFSQNENPFVTITFIPYKKFQFSISRQASGINVSGYVSTEAPGTHIETGEKYKQDNLSAAFKAIGPWADRILEDYRAKNPIVDEFEEFRKKFSEQIEEHIQDKDAHFSADEAQIMRTRLDELSAKLHEVWEKSEAAEQRLKDAEKAIERIKEDLNIFPKGVWYRMAGNKILGAVQKAMGSTEGRQFALEAAKKFLLEGPK